MQAHLGLKPSATLRWLFVPVVLVASGAPCRCADVSVDASVDRSSLTTADTLTLTIAITATGSGTLPQPRLPGLEGFAVVSSSVGQSISLGMGGGTSTATHQYVLRPERSGRLTIGAATVEHGGKTYRTKPIAITVRRGAAPAAPPTPRPPAPGGRLPAGPVEPRPGQGDEPVFVQAHVDKQRAYVNQQVTWTFTLFRGSGSADVAGYRAPTTTGFWTEDLPKVEPTQKAIGDRAYIVEQIKLALFPTRPGRLTIGPASVTCSYGFIGPTRRLNTESIAVTALPLPADGSPGGFEGTVGQWRLAASVDRARAAVGDAITYTVQVPGTGNAHTVVRPTVVEAPGIKLYDSTAERTPDRSGATIKGTARFEYILIGTRAGDYEIGPAELVYFDPAARSYRVARADPIRVSFAQGPGAPTSVASAATDEARMRALQDALRDIKPAGDGGGAAAAPIYTRGAFWALQAIPLLAIALGIVYGRRQRRLATDAAYARRTRAAGHAHQALAQLRERLHPEAAGEFYTGLHAALCRYVADKLGASAAAISPTSVGQLLEGAGATEDAAAQAAECLRRCEFGRFAPAQSTPAHRERDLDQAAAILSRLEEERLGDD
ncbi:MAG: BatD family protein [Armatimonadota bacterium]|jgi:hypothetical protein